MGDKSTTLDRRPVELIHYQEIIDAQDAAIRKLERLGRPRDPERIKRVRYVQEILIHGNIQGRDRPILRLPWPPRLEDLEQLFGVDPEAVDDVPDSAYWRKVRAHFDSVNSGRSIAGGRSR